MQASFFDSDNTDTRTAAGYNSSISLKIGFVQAISQGARSFVTAISQGFSIWGTILAAERQQSSGQFTCARPLFHRPPRVRARGRSCSCLSFLNIYRMCVHVLVFFLSHMSYARANAGVRILSLWGRESSAHSRCVNRTFQPSG